MLRQFGKKKIVERAFTPSEPTYLDHLNRLFLSEEMDKKILISLLKSLVREFSGDEGAIFIKKRDALSCMIATGTSSLIEGRRISQKTGLAGWLLKSRKSAFLQDVKKDIRFDSKENTFEPIPETIVASPIFFKEHTYGIIQVNRRKAGNPFNSADGEKLFNLANLLGFFLSHLALKKKEKERRTDEKEKRVEEILPFSTVSQSIPIGFFIIREDLRIFFANNFALKTLVLKSEETLGKKCCDVIITNDTKNNKQHLCKFLSKFPDKNYFQSPLHLLRQDGHEITVAFGISPFEFQQRKFAILYFTNPAEWEMVYSKEDEFITNVAHELRTPLFAILGSLDILENELKRIENLPPTIHSFLNIVRDEGQKFTNILNALLDFDAVSKWNIGLKKKPIAIFELVKKIVTDFNQKCKENDITIETNFPTESTQIFGDKLALQYAFSHIIDNAIKFNKPGGKIIISTEGLILRDSNWNFEMKITDTGVGIPKSEIPYLFGKFYRVEKKIHTISGFGLGLTIVKDIIDMHGGNISVDSEIGKGTTVTIELPTVET